MSNARVKLFFQRQGLRCLAYVFVAALLALAAWMHSRLEASLLQMDSQAGRVSGFWATLERELLHESFMRQGCSAQEAGAVAYAFSQKLNAKRLMPGDRYYMEYDGEGRLLHVTLLHGLKRYVAYRRGNSWQAREYDLPVTEKLFSAAGIIKGNLWLSMEREKIPADVILEFAEAFQWTVDFLSEVRDGDRFSVIWREERSAGDRVLSRRLEGMLYEGSVAGRALSVRFNGAFYDEQGRSLRRMFLRAPLQFHRISSYFSRSRYHPVLRIYRPHHGVDYAAPHGTPVSAVADGIVTFAADKGDYGRMVEVRHAGGYTTRYGHLSRFNVRAGSRVRQGQHIGYVGSTGLASGPHLHFEVHHHGRPVNFLKLRDVQGDSLSGSPLAKFRLHAAPIINTLQGLAYRP